MKNVPFAEANKIVPAPPGHDNIAPLQVNVHGAEITSCWRMSWRERWAALRYGLVWVRVRDPGGAPPPMAVDAMKTIFDKQ